MLLFKKGDATLPENYRPISLLPTGCKVLVALIDQRLLDGGVDAKIRATQYGFRPNRNCSEALMLIRRMIDAAHEMKSESLSMVFLDWAKAFDRIRGDSLLKALRRFGLPEQFVNMIGAIYVERKFFIQDHCGTSSIFHQFAGIAQGCPLSPFLFIIVQSVMFHDIYGKIHLDPEPAFLVTNEVLYADDTVLLSSSAKNLQTLMDAVVAEGANYGLELNWSKTYQMNVNSSMLLTCPDGSTLDSKRSIIYLGGLITCDGKSGTEMRRRVS